MPQLIRGDLAIKTPAEFDYRGLHGTPYCVIYCNRALKKNRLYLLDTKERLYYPIAEWDENDRDASKKWYEYLLSINDKIGEERGRLKEKGYAWSDLDKVEQIVPDEDKMIKDLQNDSWSVLIN
ncbi:hypothetical protein U5801_07800 [Lamprobacter modestohalophilus]|uniref:hypothetical protein n=1 Tax=Lamprobacter modestohalophilus TaxID=1064514 RepID=UPI002ADEBDD6|nr:hypothetical protein [Lamprobacter modestohalophilus]MEA1049709.1 hypothetical protein [Lamprobacter modestohalophilus]